MRQGHVAKMTLGLSALIHVWVFSGQASATKMRSQPAAPQTVQFVVAEPEPPPEPEPVRAVPDEPRPVAPRAPSVPAAPASETPVDESSEPAPELTGTTLVSDVGTTFAAPPGSGRVRRGAFRAGVSRALISNPKATAFTQTKSERPVEPSAVPLEHLGRLPSPPDLASDLMRNYPSEARKQGRSGEAKVRARIEPSGKVEQAKVTFETADGFGRACRQTLIGSRWSAPRDENGKRVATWVNYRCKFRIDG